MERAALQRRRRTHAFPDCAIGRRFAPIRWLHPGYRPGQRLAAGIMGPCFRRDDVEGFVRHPGRINTAFCRSNTWRPFLKPISTSGSSAMAPRALAVSSTMRSAGLPGAMP